MAAAFSRFLTMLALAASGSAWASPDCPVTPFGDASPVQYEAGLSGRCQAESSRWKVEAPRAKPTDVGPSVMKAEFTSFTGLRLSPLLAALRFDWSGLRGSEAAGNPKAERAALAMGGLLRLHDQLALQTSVGLEYTGFVQRSRATFGSVWQPSKLGVLFAEWAGSELGTEAHRVGGRWWVVPQRLSIDLGARRLPDGPWIDQRVGVSFSLPL
jgi:hypothetical protein